MTTTISEGKLAFDSHSYRWIFHGNIVIPTANPFSASAHTRSTHDVEWLGPGLKLCRHHILAVDHDGIILVVSHESAFDTTLMTNATGYIKLQPHEFLCPGMVDTHIHAPQYAYTGTATDKPLMGADGWLETYTFPAEQSLQNNPTKAKQVFERVVRKTLNTGTTCAVYFATLHLGPCKILADVAFDLGQRALVGKVCMDRESPGNYVQSTQQNVDETKQLIDYIQTKAGKLGQQYLLPKLLPIVTPRFIPTCSPALLTQLGHLVKEYDGIHIQSHISESKDQVAFTAALEGSERSDAEIFASHGLLSDRCIMAHGVHLSDYDLDLMRGKGSAVAHCPHSNFFFAGGTLACRKLMERDNRIGLGTDVAGGYSPSMLHATRMAVVGSRARDHECPDENAILDYRHAFYLATLGGAEALGLEDRIGTFSKGMEFDAIILSPATNIDVFDDTDTTADIFQKIINLGDDRNVKEVYVQGKAVLRSDRSDL